MNWSRSDFKISFLIGAICLLACQAAPYRCGMGFSAGMGETLWQLNIEGGTLTYARLNPGLPGNTPEDSLLTAVWRWKKADVAAQFCRSLDTLKGKKFQPPVLDGAVWFFYPAPGIPDHSLHPKHFIVGNVPQNGEAIEPVIHFAEAISDSIRRVGHLLFGLQWNWPQKGSTDSFAKTIPLTVRRFGNSRVNVDVTAKLYWGRDKWDTRFPGPPPIDTSIALSREVAQCLIGNIKGNINSNVHGNPKGKSSSRYFGTKFTSCTIDLPSEWKTAQVELRGTHTILGESLSFTTASEYLLRP